MCLPAESQFPLPCFRPRHPQKNSWRAMILWRERLYSLCFCVFLSLLGFCLHHGVSLPIFFSSTCPLLKSTQSSSRSSSPNFLSPYHGPPQPQAFLLSMFTHSHDPQLWLQQESPWNNSLISPTTNTISPMSVVLSHLKIKLIPILTYYHFLQSMLFFYCLPSSPSLKSWNKSFFTLIFTFLCYSQPVFKSSNLRSYC